MIDCFLKSTANVTKATTQLFRHHNGRLFLALEASVDKSLVGYKF